MSSKTYFDADTIRSLSVNPRATLVAWERFSHIVVSAFQASPAPFTYLPTGLSPYSVASKIRDAIRGKLAFDYPCVIDNDVLTKWWEGVVVTNTKEKVTIGPRKRDLPAVDGTVHGDAAFIFDTLPFPELDAFELLLSTGRIKGPILLTKPPIGVEEGVNSIYPNVERIFRPDGKLILL